MCRFLTLQTSWAKVHLIVKYYYRSMVNARRDISDISERVKKSDIRHLKSYGSLFHPWCNVMFADEALEVASFAKCDNLHSLAFPFLLKFLSYRKKIWRSCLVLLVMKDLWPHEVSSCTCHTGSGPIATIKVHIFRRKLNPFLSHLV